MEERGAEPGDGNPLGLGRAGQEGSGLCHGMGHRMGRASAAALQRAGHVEQMELSYSY